MDGRGNVVLWVSRHLPDNEQLMDLEFICGGPVKCELLSDRISSAQEVIDAMRETGADEVVVVLPDDLIADIVRAGIRPLRAKMTPSEKPTESKRFNHLRFQRITRFDLTVDDLPTHPDRRG